jgi:hypothetical protein
MATILTIEQIIETRANKYVGDVRIPNLIILADDFIGDKIPVGNPANYAKALQILHWLTMSDRVDEGNGGVGSIIEEKEGELTIKYSAGTNVMALTSDWKAELNQTIFGRELYAFAKRYIVMAVTRFT